MNLTLWILQYFVASAFLYSGISKSVFSEQKLIVMGMTGVEGLPLSFIRFIGITEILGSFGIILPWLLDIYPVLTIVSALCFAVIMIPAAVIHYKRKEFKSVFFNALLFLMNVFIIVGRIGHVCI